MLKINCRKVCDRCLTITMQDRCPECGHNHFKNIVITVQDGRKDCLL